MVDTNTKGLCICDGGMRRTRPASSPCRVSTPHCPCHIHQPLSAYPQDHPCKSKLKLRLALSLSPQFLRVHTYVLYIVYPATEPGKLVQQALDPRCSAVIGLQVPLERLTYSTRHTTVPWCVCMYVLSCLDCTVLSALPTSTKGFVCFVPLPTE